MNDGIRAGDVCIVIRSALADYPPGTEVTVLEVQAPEDRTHPNCPYVIERSRRRIVVGSDRELRKKRPPAVREALGDWALCPWRPGVTANASVKATL